MANNGTLKMKMLALQEILQQESDIANPLTTNEICEKLQARGIPCERKSVATDVELLKKHGYSVETKQEGRGWNILLAAFLTGAVGKKALPSIRS